MMKKQESAQCWIAQPAAAREGGSPRHLGPDGQKDMPEWVQTSPRIISFGTRTDTHTHTQGKIYTFSLCGL